MAEFGYDLLKIYYLCGSNNSFYADCMHNGML